MTWQVTRFPKEMAYDGLDPNVKYVVRTTGARQSNLRINGERVLGDYRVGIQVASKKRHAKPFGGTNPLNRSFSRPANAMVVPSS
jgi:hypothetical protein